MRLWLFIRDRLLPRTPITHDYAVVVRRLRPEEGGGFIATIPQLGTGTFNGVGETPEEALRGLDCIYNYLRPTMEGEFMFPPPKDEDCIRFGEHS
jgi:hypothetical protein